MPDVPLKWSETIRRDCIFLCYSLCVTRVSNLLPETGQLSSFQPVTTASEWTGRIQRLQNDGVSEALHQNTWKSEPGYLAGSQRSVVIHKIWFELISESNLTFARNYALDSHGISRSVDQVATWIGFAARQDVQGVTKACFNEVLRQDLVVSSPVPIMNNISVHADYVGSIRKSTERFLGARPCLTSATKLTQNSCLAARWGKWLCVCGNCMVVKLWIISLNPYLVYLAVLEIRRKEHKHQIWFKHRIVKLYRTQMRTKAKRSLALLRFMTKWVGCSDTQTQRQRVSVSYA